MDDKTFKGKKVKLQLKHLRPSLIKVGNHYQSVDEGERLLINISKSY